MGFAIPMALRASYRAANEKAPDRSEA